MYSEDDMDNDDIIKYRMNPTKEEPFDWNKPSEEGNRYIPIRKAEELRKKRMSELEAELEKLKEEHPLGGRMKRIRDINEVKK